MAQTDSVNTFLNYVSMLNDSKEDLKLKAAQEISEHFEVIVQSAYYPSFLEHFLKTVIRILQETKPIFIQEHKIQHVRKLLLEMVHRLPITENLRQHVKPIISLMLTILRTDNEENVLIALRIIIELHKQFRPSFNPEIQLFLAYVKEIYADLPNRVSKIFEPLPQTHVADLLESKFGESLIDETYAIRSIQIENATESISFSNVCNLLPKGILSLRVLQELPIIVVLMYQIYKNAVHQEVSEFIPLIMTTINLQPTQAQRNSQFFNKEIFIDFMGAQIKTLSFLAYIVRIYQDAVLTHSQAVTNGMINLMQLCPKEAAHLRKELLIAARHIFATDLRQKFVPSIEKLFDEDILIGKGVTLDSIRPLAYSTLADLAHHVRQSLSLTVLEKAVTLFSKNVHDDSLAIGIQTMSCKLLLNLVDCVRQHSEVDYAKTRQILTSLLKVFAYKFKTFTNRHLPSILQKWKGQNTSNVSSSQTNNACEYKETCDYSSIEAAKGSQLLSNISEYRSLIKTLVGGVKTITWGFISSKCPNTDGANANEEKLFKPNELLIYIDMVYWALETLDIYTMNPVNQNHRTTNLIPRTKEEKEVLEHFSGIFLMMHSQNFQEIFSTTIDFIVERIYKNPSLQVIANSFLANPTTSPLFATVLVEYLLTKMEDMGTNVDRSNLYLRLFKLVFGSVSLFPVDNEHMLRPHLHKIVNRSMELALTAEEPYNYFLLLRALFRSIGGGSHDLLYQEFLPLLPNLLEGLNRLQSGFHKQHMKDLFVELCLTVPVRLSSLLPYLPMLMDPLVSALNGSPTLISQGLRTLELCVDNLQPDFLYDHIQPVRASLMQALWKTLRSQDSAALVAFRVLGKFGGGNRKMMIEPQVLMYKEFETSTTAIKTFFQEHDSSIDFPIDDIIETAFLALNSNLTDGFYRRQCWEVIRCYLAASINLEDEKHILQKFFLHPSFTESNVMNYQGIQNKYEDIFAKKTHETAITGMFVASATKDLRESVFPVMVAIVRHYTMIAIAQQAGPMPYKQQHNCTNIDPSVLIDALTVCMGHEEKELIKPGQLCIRLILDTSTNIMGSKERACKLPFIQYLAEKMSGLCYERPWYSKVGGCKAIRFLYQQIPSKSLYQNIFGFLKALLFVLMDLENEVSNGAIDIAKGCLKNMLEIWMFSMNNEIKTDETHSLQNKASYEVIHELVRQVTSPNFLVRNESMASLKYIAEFQKKTVTEIMDPHKEVLVDIIPPKKHLLRHQPANAQIGLMDGNTFCTTLEPRLFTINLSNSYHRLFFHELLTLSEAEDTTLNKLDCYKNVTNLIPLRSSALYALAACHYINDDQYKDKIVNILFKVLESNKPELQEVAFKCMKQFTDGVQIDKDKIHIGMRPLLLTLGDHRNLSLSATRRLSYFTRLFPQMFNEKLSEQILNHCQEILKAFVSRFQGVDGNHSGTNDKVDENEKKIVLLIEMFHQITAASSKYLEILCQLVLQTENDLLIEPSSPFRKALLKFLLRFPQETVDLFLSNSVIIKPQWNRFFIFLLKNKEGQRFLDEVKQQKNINIIKSRIDPYGPNNQNTDSSLYETQRQSILIIYTIMEFDNQWISKQLDIVNELKLLWKTSLYMHCKDNIVCDLWHLVGKILLLYFSHNTADIDLLYQLLRAFCFHFIPEFYFLRDFLQNTVANNFTVCWKRKAFFCFVEHFNNPSLSDDVKAKFITAVLIPCFVVSFEKGEGNKLVLGVQQSNNDDDNVVSVFINKVFDPEKPFANDDAVRIALLQFACLLVERASQYIHDGDANNKNQGNKLRRLMTFAWPCLLNKNSVDPTARYHGHLLLSHIIARLAIHKKIVLQVFHSLLKGHALEARPVVRQALDVLTPAMPLRMEDGNTMLTHWTKKIIVEEGHSMQQLFHILQLIVRHYKVYYPVRHHLIQHLVNYMQRLGLPPNASLEYKKLSVDIAEIIIKWELQHFKEEDKFVDLDENVSDSDNKIKRICMDDTRDAKKKNSSENYNSLQGNSQNMKADDGYSSIEKSNYDNVLNFLMRLACQVNDAPHSMVSSVESLSRRCITLLKMAMRPECVQFYELRLNWLDKVFSTIETPHANLINICTGLEFLTFLMTILKNEQVLTIIRSIQKGLSYCIIHQSSRIVRPMHLFLTKLMSVFPPDSNLKHDDLEILYNNINKTIIDNMTLYEKSPQPNPSSLYGTLMILKAASASNISYIDRIMLQFIRVLNRLSKEHINLQNNTQAINVSPENTSMALELLTMSLDLIKTRVAVMGAEIRKHFLGSILLNLIEKSLDVKIIKCIIKILEDWVKCKDQNINMQIPSIREKSVLLVKMMQNIDKKFPDDMEVNVQFLELLNYIYRDEYLKQTELTAKLEGGYLSGLRCQLPHIRSKFFETLDASMRRRLHDRLLYIICSQSWDAISTHYWIKQAIELLILTSNTMTQIQNWNDTHKVPSITSVINSAENQDSFVFYTSSKFEATKYIDEKDDAFDIELNTDIISKDKDGNEKREIIVIKLINRQYEFLESSRKIRTDQFLVATSQLCHMSTNLAETVWLSLFPRIWQIFDEDQQDIITKEIILFLASGSNVIQKDCSPSAINTFVEGLIRCDPPIFIPPNLMTYLAKAHNLWHRMTLSLEDIVLKGGGISKHFAKAPIDHDQFNEENSFVNVSIYDSLSQMYSIMQEEDLWAGLWLKYAKYPETNIAIAYEQMGFFEEAQGVYDLAMMKFKQDLSTGSASSSILSEMSLWENHWVRCAKELNQWDILLEYAQTSKDKNMLLILESAWRIPDWTLMKHALMRTEQTISKQQAYKLNIYKGFLAILYKEENQICNAERYIEMASGLCMREWRRLPPIVSHMHLQYLQAAQQIMELHEASQIHQGLIQSRNSSVHDIKAIVKTWRNRLPVIGDDLSHWSDILTWRQHHYQIITQYLEQQSDQANTMLGVHASAQAIIHFGKMARKHHLTGVCQEILSRIYTIPSVPIVDCFQKIRQQVKCYLQMASIHGKTELNAALEVIESTNLKYFTAEMNAEFYALKGLLLSLIDRSDEAAKSFSAAIQLHDGLTKAWAMWGDYLEHLFLKDRQIVLGVNALTCYLHACRHQSENKTRKYIAKILWLLTYDNSVGTLMDTLEKYVVGVPPSYWLIWIPQLLCCLVQYEGNVMLNLLSHVGRLYPQAVYFPIRTLYLTLKIEQREKHKTAEQTGKNSSLLDSHVIPPLTSTSSTTVNPIKATPSMWRCSKVMHVQREIHPTILSSLEGIVDQMVWFRESWTEEVLRQLRQGLIKCYAIAFENRSSVNDATITPHTLHFMKKLGSTFGIGIENVPGVVPNTASSNSSASESLARRAQVTFQDPVFQKMKEQFTSDFDFSKPGAMKLHNLISKLKTWIKALEVKVKKLPVSFLIEDKCRFLSNFSQKTAEVELPGELLLPSSCHYHIRIARFMPRVEIVQKNNTAARRLYIRGTNGKVYPYLVVIDTGLGDARREERVLQLMRMLNYYLEKQKETTRRFLHMTVPRVVPISPQMRLAEDNPASISLHEIYKNCCVNLKTDHDLPIVKYYERLSEVQLRGTQTTHTVLCEIYSEIQTTMVPNKLLKKWAQQTFLNASDFWQFRKMLTLQVALASLCEYSFHLTRLNVDMMYFHQDSGLMNSSYFKFEINDEKEELDSSRPVPFRLTPNIAEFLTNFGITGPFSAAIIATSRCFVQPNYNISSILKTILRDEISSLQKRRIRDNKQLESGDDVMESNIENIIKLVNRAESVIMKRLHSISSFENIDSKTVSILIQSAINPDNLCRMDPAWHPWL